MKRILLQTTIPPTEDDWNINRFSMLAEYLGSLTDADGSRMFSVTARNRENDANGDDHLLPRLEESDFDQLWLFGVDVGSGLTAADCAGITRFRERGGGLLTTRDHQDLGLSFCTLGGVGAAHHFHSKNPELDPNRLAVDDTESAGITWPNYHSGSNGDFQRIRVLAPSHPIVKNPASDSGLLEFLPSHPHEGAVSVPPGDSSAHVIATGRSQFTGKEFNIVVAFESSADKKGRGVAESSFHHFLDYNFDPRKGCPSFVTEKPGKGMLENPRATQDSLAYIRNLATWLS